MRFLKILRFEPSYIAKVIACASQVALTSVTVAVIGYARPVAN
jgi:hypothetical protein